jgi:hypothetical protein
MTDLLCSESAGSCGSQIRATVDDGEAAFGDRAARILDPSLNQLFAVTLRLTAMATEQTDAREANRLLGAVHEIDDAIRRIRADLIAELLAARAGCDGPHVSWD